MQALRTIAGFFLFLIAGYQFDRGKLAAARNWMDRALATGCNQLPIILANDAILLLLEDRLAESRERFAECVAALPVEKDANHHYVDCFCRFYIAALSGKASQDELLTLSEHASSVQAEEWILRRLRFPSAESIAEQFGSSLAKHRA
ncbi:hypothetical protein [Aurantiacibacter gilvus]|uniref:Sel1 repeat family protein n=1 Tax=Aurantiacibacter gilvus TaxID=3139141 RepID=A0ABU9IHM6_9SPHN